MGGIAEVALKLMKISIKTGQIMAIILTFSAVLGLVLSVIVAGVNLTIFADIVALVQMWLPFNIAPIFLWILTVAGAYLMFRLAVLVMNFTNNWLES